MPILQNVLLGVLVGYQLAFARVDSIWWPYLNIPVDKLKSKIPFTSRSNAANFYRSIHESPYNLDYFLLACWVLVLLSFIGGVVQHPSKRMANIAGFVSMLAAGIVELIYARPIMKAIVQKSSGKLLDNLFNVGYFHAIVFGCFVVCTLVTVSQEAEEDGGDDDDEDEKVEKKKSKKRAKESSDKVKQE